MVPILGENGRKYNISTKKYNILRPHLFDISWFKRQSLTFMILKYRFNSFRDLSQWAWPIAVSLKGRAYGPSEISFIVHFHSFKGCRFIWLPLAGPTAHGHSIVWHGQCFAKQSQAFRPYWPLA